MNQDFPFSISTESSGSGFKNHSLRYTGERILGLASISAQHGAAALWIPTRETLLGGTRLSVAEPQGTLLQNQQLHAQAITEFKDLTGASWIDQIGNELYIYDHLVDPGERANYLSKSYLITYDPEGSIYYGLTCTVAGLHLEITGALGTWSAIFIAAPLSPAEALVNGQPRHHPLNPLELVHQAVPKLFSLPWTIVELGLPYYIFDVSLAASTVTLRSGIRAHGSADENAYAYGVRINWEKDPAN